MAGDERARVWVDGRLLDDPDEGVITVRDHGLTVGDGVFEAIKVVDGRPFALTRHLKRLARSAQGLGLAACDEARVREAVDSVLDGLTMPLGRLRITYTAGPAPMGSGRGDEVPGTLVVAVAPLQARAGPAQVVTVPWPRNERGAVAGLKTTSYAENVVALAHAADRGADEAVFANFVGNLCEGTGSNVFYVVAGELRTPTLDSGCLAGITRELVLEWCDVVQVDEPITVLQEAEEVFLTSTTRDVQWVARCDDRRWAGAGPLTRHAAHVWSEREPADLDP